MAGNPELRGLADGVGKLQVPSVAAAARRDHGPPWRDQIGDLLAGVRVEHDGTDGHADHYVVAVRAVLARAGAVATALGGELLLELEIEEGVHLGIDQEDGVAPLAAVATIGPA